MTTTNQRLRQRKPVGSLAGARLSRRRLLALGSLTPAGAASLLATGCRRGTASTAPAEPPPSGRETVTSTPTGAETATAADPTPARTATASPTVSHEEQVFYQSGFASDPISHDFNADLYCGGEPTLWAGLLRLDGDLQPVPDWAEAWESNPEGTVWTFRLRRDNQGWSNGDPVTAHDFVWSWRRLLDPATGSPYPMILFDVKNARAVNEGTAAPEDAGVRPEDDWTLHVEMEAPRAGFPAIAASLATVPAHRLSVEQFGDQWTEAGNCVSNGPFKLDRWDHGVAFEISRNDRYWDAASIRLTRCVTPILADDEGLRPYEAGEVDAIAVPGPDLERIRQDPVLSQQLKQTVDAAVWFLLPQVTVPPFDDIRVRQAVSHAIDRERLVQITQGRSTAAHSLMPPGFPGHLETDEIVMLQQFDVDRALEVLRDTPFSGGRNWPEIPVTLRQSDADAELMARDIAEQLRENLGMPASVVVLDPQEFNQAVWEHRLGLTWYRWWFDYADPNNGYADVFGPGASGTRRVAWSSVDFDALVESARQEMDSTRRLELYQECERLLQQEVAYIPVAYPVRYLLVKPWVQGIPTNQQGYDVLDVGLFTRMKTAIRIEGRPAS